MSSDEDAQVCADLSEQMGMLVNGALEDIPGMIVVTFEDSETGECDYIQIGARKISESEAQKWFQSETLRKEEMH